MTARTASIGAAILLALSCSRKSEPKPGGVAASTTPSAARGTFPSGATVPSLAPAGSESGLVVRPPVKSCRAIDVKGSVVSDDGAKLATDGALDGGHWLTLAKGASLTVKHATTTREVTFEGPAHLVACDRGEERFLITSGHVRTMLWAGARPGAEVLVATPYGVVRYGNAKLDVQVDARGFRVASESGEAWIDDGSAGAETKALRKVKSGGSAEQRGSTSDVKALIARCESAATDAEARARAVLAPDVRREALGLRAAAHVRARQAARDACAIAETALGTLKMGADRASFGKAIASAEARWRAVPSAHLYRKVESR